MTDKLKMPLDQELERIDDNGKSLHEVYLLDDANFIIDQKRFEEFDKNLNDLPQRIPALHELLNS